MKLLSSVLSPTEEDLEIMKKAEDLPFVQFLKERSLTDTVISFLLYSIALIDTESMAFVIHFGT